VSARLRGAVTLAPVDVGENGTGKSTILKCAACGYENADRSKRFFPSSFFVETHWDTISGVTIDYRVKLGASVRTYRTTKPSQRWRVPEDMPNRNVFLMNVSRTLPWMRPSAMQKLPVKRPPSRFANCIAKPPTAPLPSNEDLARSGEGVIQLIDSQKKRRTGFMQ
jgi:hypothetical protein